MEEKAQIENNSHSSPSAEKRSDGTAVVDDEISLKELILKIKEWWRHLLSKWVVILIVGIIGGLIGLAYSFYKKPIYTATTTFVLESGDGGGGGLGQYAGLASMVGVDIGGGGGSGIFSSDNILELYKSRSMLQKALLHNADFSGKKEILVERYIQFNKLWDKWDEPRIENLSFADSANFTVLQDSVLGEVVKKINKESLSVVKPDKKLSIIKVAFISKDEQFAKAFTDQIVMTVNDFFVQTKTKKAIENVKILQRQADSVKAVMNGAIFSSASTIDATPNLNPTRQVLRAPIQRSQFNAEANKAILTELVKNLELSKISLRKETPLIQVIDKPIFPLDFVKPEWETSIPVGALLGIVLIVLILTIQYFKKSLV